MFVARQAQKPLQEAAGGYPVLVVVGPRQSGKTTLCKATFPKHPYASLEDPDVQRFAVSDPRGFLQQFPDGALLDEVQRAPELLSYLQGIVDQSEHAGQFVLTGSQQLDVLAGVTQTLAGRAAILNLLPFSYGEIAKAKLAPESLTELLHKGLYPPIYDRHLDPRGWYGNYVQTYVERDVRQLINVRDLGSFQVFLRLCAGRTGQLLNLSSLAADCGITHNTAKAWISALEASYIVTTLRPHFSNFGKRMVKTPKLYFLDPGLAAWLLEIANPDQLRSHPLRGPLFETWVVSELIKGRTNRGLTSNLYFWRDRRGLEVDVVLDRGTTLVPIEAKSGSTVARDFYRSINRFAELAGEAAGHGWVVYGGERLEQREHATAIPWTSIEQISAENG